MNSLFILLLLTLMIPVQLAYAGGPRGDWPSGATQEEGDCWVDGYDAGFAGKYDEDRADFCKEKGDDLYNSSWEFACDDAGYMPDECQDFQNNPKDIEHAALKEENRRTCYDDGYEEGKQEDAFDVERNFRCGEFGNPYEEGFMDSCQIKDTRVACEIAIEVERNATFAN